MLLRAGIWAIAALVLICSAGALLAATGPEPETGEPATQPAPTFDIEATAKDIRRMLRQELGDNASDIKVRVDDPGYTRVVLSGSVPDEATRAQIKKLITSRVKRARSLNYDDSHLEISTDLRLLSSFALGGRPHQHAVSPNFAVLAADLDLFDVQTGKKLQHVDLGHELQVTALTFADDERLAVGGYWEESPPAGARHDELWVWDVKDGKAGARLWAHASTSANESATAGAHRTALSMRALAATPDGKILAAIRDDQRIVFWNVESGREMGSTGNVPPAQNRDFYVAAFSPDGKLLAAIAESQDPITLWDVAAQKARGTLTVQDLMPLDIVWSPDGRRIAAGGRELDLFEVEGGAHKQLSGVPGRVDAVAFSPDGVLLAAAHRNSGVVVWNVAEVIPWRRLGVTRLESDVQTVAFSPDGARLLTVGTHAKVWDIAGRPVKSESKPAEKKP